MTVEPAVLPFRKLHAVCHFDALAYWQVTLGRQTQNSASANYRWA